MPVDNRLAVAVSSWCTVRHLVSIRCRIKYRQPPNGYWSGSVQNSILRQATARQRTGYRLITINNMVADKRNSPVMVILPPDAENIAAACFAGLYWIQEINGSVNGHFNRGCDGFNDNESNFFFWEQAKLKLRRWSADHQRCCHKTTKTKPAVPKELYYLNWSTFYYSSQFFLWKKSDLGILPVFSKISLFLQKAWKELKKWWFLLYKFWLKLKLLFEPCLCGNKKDYAKFLKKPLKATICRKVREKMFTILTHPRTWECCRLVFFGGGRPQPMAY